MVATKILPQTLQAPDHVQLPVGKVFEEAVTHKPDDILPVVVAFVSDFLLQHRSNGNYRSEGVSENHKLKKKLPAMKVLSMSFRGTDQYNQATYSGALMMDDKFYFSPVYSLPQIIDRIGSGDAFQGGLLYGLINNLPGQDIINFAIASGALKHSIEGDFAYFSKEEVEHFIKNGAVNRVIR